ncbi:hypothetical protein KIW84_070640 [Lathyrus oleraceus]|uniref:Uncharacterized protein n=1 Tax=Pisum sativum TaxID=3888 RepID=A0A9D4VIC5_PEA|nr:hypothetical protein KIW84_070640 [Pisum sativum]
MVSVKDDPVSVEQVVEVVEVSNSSCEVCPNLQQTKLQLLCLLLALEGAVCDLTSSAMDELRTFSEAIKALLTTSANALEPLWHELSCCISKIESYSEPTSEISIPFISIWSARLIVISTSIHTSSLQASNNTYHIQVNSQP